MIPTRQDIIQQLKQQEPSARGEASLPICETLKQCLENRSLSQGRVGVFSPLSWEVNVSALNLQVPCYPKVSGEEIDFYEGVTQWSRSSLGVLEPQDGVQIEALDVVVVPGLLFGRQGERWGRGKGYYDRFLSKLPKALRVGVAFDFQVFDKLEVQPWDMPMHMLITPTQTLSWENE